MLVSAADPWSVLREGEEVQNALNAAALTGKHIDNFISVFHRRIIIASSKAYSRHQEAALYKVLWSGVLLQ